MQKALYFCIALVIILVLAFVKPTEGFTTLMGMTLTETNAGTPPALYSKLPINQPKVVDLAERSTEPVKPAPAPKADSDALQQGSWFRSAASEGCPYAQGQVSTEEPLPPFDMSQYIRKDKIPCWGCTLK
jgi:hypothetical protein